MFEAVITNEFRDKEFMINSIVNGTLVRTPVSPLDVFSINYNFSYTNDKYFLKRI